AFVRVHSLDSFFLLFFLYCSSDHRDLHSFPTRRSSDLLLAKVDVEAVLGELPGGRDGWLDLGLGVDPGAVEPVEDLPGAVGSIRSEEHTSELQSQSNLVCRLLLEKKKNMNNDTHEADLL